jgi:hypothetical protein
LLCKRGATSRSVLKLATTLEPHKPLGAASRPRAPFRPSAYLSEQLARPGHELSLVKNVVERSALSASYPGEFTKALHMVAHSALITSERIG